MGKIILIIIVAALSFSSLNAKEAVSSLPQEVDLLLQELKAPPFTEKQQMQLNEWEKRANLELSKMAKLDFFVISKGMIFKFFIDLAAVNEQLRYKGTPAEALSFLSTMTKDTKATPLTQWLCLSLHKDLAAFLQSNEYLNRQKTPISENSRIKMNYISTLVALLKQSGSEDFSSRIRPQLFRLAERIFNYGQYFLYFTVPPKDELTLGKVFYLQNSVSKPATLDDILAPAFPALGQEISKQTEEWQPKESPLLLPKAVNDWDNDNEMTIRLVDPHYTPPEQLPSPVNDWEENGDDQWNNAPTLSPQAPIMSRPTDPEDDWVLR